MSSLFCEKTFSALSQKRKLDFIRQSFKNFDELNPLYFFIIKNHPETANKVGVGIKRFYLCQNPFNKTALQLNIERVDGTKIDFSFISCVKGATVNNGLNSALRASISEQILKFKNKWLLANLLSCFACGQEGAADEFDVDHDLITFSKLSANFLKIFTNVPKTYDDCPKYNRAIFKKEDLDFEKAWKDFHFKNARLQILCKKCHKEKTKGSYEL